MFSGIQNVTKTFFFLWLLLCFYTQPESNNLFLERLNRSYTNQDVNFLNMFEIFERGIVMSENVQNFKNNEHRCFPVKQTTPFWRNICEWLLLFSVTILYYIFRSSTNLHLKLKKLKKQAACRKPVSIIASHLGNLYFKDIQSVSRNLVSLVETIHIVCTHFFPKK